MQCLRNKSRRGIFSSSFRPTTAVADRTYIQKVIQLVKHILRGIFKDRISSEKGLFVLGRHALRPSLNIEINNFDLSNIKRSTWTSAVSSNEGDGGHFPLRFLKTGHFMSKIDNNYHVAFLSEIS